MLGLMIRVNTFVITFAVCFIGLAQAQAPQGSRGRTKAAAPKSSKRQAPPVQQRTSGGAVVFVDPATRQVREPTPAEIGALSGSAQVPLQSSTTLAPTEIRGPGGAVGIILGDESRSYMVITKNPDGKLVSEEVTGKKAAADRVAPDENIAPGHEK
jgi:hypothetical protein